MWQHWVNAILGLWIILSSFLGMDVSTMMANLVIVGIAIAILGFWGAYDTSTSGSRQMHA